MHMLSIRYGRPPGPLSTVLISTTSSFSVTSGGQIFWHWRLAPPENGTFPAARHDEGEGKKKKHSLYPPMKY
jgi:hypothetical protein